MDGTNAMNNQIFQPGDKVIMVDDVSSNCPCWHVNGQYPEKGELYCVSDFIASGCHVRAGNKLGLLLWNAVNLCGIAPPLWNGVPIGWCACNFRKVDEIKLILEAFKKFETPKQPQEVSP